MEMVKVKMEIPKDVLFAARIGEKVAAQELKRELAVHLFERNILSLGKAAELAEMTRIDFMDLLGGREISLHYDVDDWRRDLETPKRKGK